MNERKSVKRSLALALIVFLVMAFGMTGSAFAAEKGPVKVEIPISQTFTVTGTDRAIDTKVIYVLEANDKGNPMPAASEITVDGTDDTLGFAITFDHAGVFTYTLRPMAKTQAGCTYDATEYTVYAKIVNELDKNGVPTGVLLPAVKVEPKLSPAASEEEKFSSAIYVHTYCPAATDPSLMVDPPVKKIVTGSPSASATFKFTLTAGKATNPMPEGSSNGKKTIEIVGQGEKEFGQWAYTEAGSYTYTISEENTGEANYTYDTAVYTFTDVVTDEDGQLILKRTVERKVGDEITETEATADLVLPYTNVYKAAEQPVVPVVQGKDGPKTGDDTNIMGLITIVVISAVALIGCILFFILRKRRDDEEKKNEIRC